MVHKFIVLFGLTLLANLTTPVKLYFSKDVNPNHERQPKYKISKTIAPLKELIEHISLSRSKGKEYNLPHDQYDCMPGEICITKHSHKEDNIVINNALRNNYKDHSLHEDTSNSASEEFIDYSDDDRFHDLTRIERALKGKKALKYNDERFSANHVNVDDLLRTSKNEDSYSNKKRIKRQSDNDNAYNEHRKYLIARREDSDDSGETSDSMSTEDKFKKQKITWQVPKRFAVVDSGKKTKYKKISSSSDEKPYESEEVTTRKPKKRVPKRQKKRKGKRVEQTEKKEREIKEMYMQAPGRTIKVGKWFSDEEEDTYRRRLQHFLPKRYHWSVKDYKNLGTFWFNGPQGRYPGMYKIGY